tara:strand:- start:357 stop:830 length:474 start_codon:yes stop_codon:yes gene_type:complete
MEKYNTAEDAFNSLKIGTQFKKIHCRKLLKQVIEANWECKHWASRGKPICSTFELCILIFLNELRFLSKSIRVGMTPDDKVVIFADVYDSADDIIMCREIVNKTKNNNNNINIEMFHKSYGELDFKNGFRPPKTTKYYYHGYTQFYRGNLIGLIITP